jgi:hypothetical protein
LYAGRVLKENIDICTDILTLLFTKSLETGKVPSDWNHANVTPVLKKGDKHNPGNYRPISITCIACKLLEHIFASNMMQHLETNNILYELQHGFRAKRSCESQIISLIHDLSQNNDKNIQTDLIIMDFAKAALWFDLSIDHTVICKKSDMAMFDVFRKVVNID